MREGTLRSGIGARSGGRAVFGGAGYGVAGAGAGRLYRSGYGVRSDSRPRDEGASAERGTAREYGSGR